jgi:hypothetical protein
VAYARNGPTPVKAPFKVQLNDPCIEAKFIPQRISDLTVFRQDPDFELKQVMSFDPFTYDVLQRLHVDCGLVSHRLIYTDSSNVVEPWITLGDDEIQLDFGQTKSPGVWNMGLVSWLSNYPYVNTTSRFTIKQAWS